MTKDHTPGRLTTYALSDRLQRNALLAEGPGTGKPVMATHIRRHADARRLAAAWNVCEGISTEVLELNATAGGVATLERQRDQAKAERDTLRAALAGPLSDAESDALYENAHDDGWCAHDVSPKALEAMFARVLASRQAAAATDTLPPPEPLNLRALAAEAERDRLREALQRIAGLKLDQCMGPNAMALEAVSIAKEAIANTVTGPSIAELQAAGHLPSQRKPDNEPFCKVCDVIGLGHDLEPDASGGHTCGACRGEIPF